MRRIDTQSTAGIIRVGSQTDEDLVTRKLIARFKELLGSGALKPGERLPPERDLAVQFGVSRSSLRQALKVLESMGIVAQRVGQGTRLNSNAAAILSEPFEFLVLIDGISIVELHEARIIVEPELAARAAERATLDHLSILRKTIETMKKHGSDPVKRIEQDLLFHSTIHRAAGNRVCEHMFTGVRALMASIRVTTHRVPYQHTIAFHTPIYEAIYARDPRLAREKMMEHLVETREQLLLHSASEAHPGNARKFDKL
jgi:GntR family transcriptional repressor for pyruvate dehydrogenase complex